MERLEETVRTSRISAAKSALGSVVTVFDKDMAPFNVDLDSFHKNIVTFGRNSGNDLQLKSMLVSREHGRFIKKEGRWFIEDKAVYGDKPSSNGLLYNDSSVTSMLIRNGDFIRIDNSLQTVKDGVLFVFSSSDTDSRWSAFDLSTKTQVTIGRSSSCNIVLPHITVSGKHATLYKLNENWYIKDNNSTNGVIVDNKQQRGLTRLQEKDIINIGNSKLIYTGSALFYCSYKKGITVDVSDIVIVRGKGKKKRTTSNHVSLNVNPGELVAIIGGSGAGKSTVLKCMCGYLKPQNGSVYIGGVNLYQNFNSLKRIIGYVPQTDIVYDDLSLYDMLKYAAKLRLPDDISDSEREQAINRAIATVELNGEKYSLINRLSGGQRKRASIAVELLSDPNLLFLDEPASGLDPGTERNLMQSLRKMADSGKTIVLVTHSTLQLKLCDKIVFMGNGGNLCYYGAYNDALRFFGVSDIIDTYNMMADNSKELAQRFERLRGRAVHRSRSINSNKRVSTHRIKQFGILSSRYFKLVLNDKTRLLLLSLLPPALAFCISLVADGNQFEQYEATKSLLFVLSCIVFWIGLLNAIQEVCKERSVLKREYMTGESLSAYVLSKIFVLGNICLVQSIVISGIFSLVIGLPERGIITSPFIELCITTFLTAIAATATGLFVSTLFDNGANAMTAVPFVLLPQVLFSGLLFKLEGVTKVISCIAVCRWSMEGYGTAANLNDLTLRLQQEGLPLVHEAEDFFTFTGSHMLSSWCILVIYTISLMILTRLFLSNIKK